MSWTYAGMCAPIHSCKKSLEKMEEGDTLKLIFDNASSGETIIQMCEQAGHEILEQTKDSGKIIFMIEKG